MLAMMEWGCKQEWEETLKRTFYKYLPLEEDEIHVLEKCDAH